MESAHALNLFTKYSFCKQPISHQSKYFDQLIYKWLLYGNLNCSFHWMFSLIVRWGIKSPVGELLSVHGWIWRMKKCDMTPPSLSVFLVVYFFWHWILRVDTREFKISRHQCLGKFHLKKEITIIVLIISLVGQGIYSFWWCKISPLTKHVIAALSSK